MKRETLPPGPYSFTTTLLREMSKLLIRNNEVKIDELYHHLIRRPAGLPETPVYVPSIKKGAREGICLSPIDHGNIVHEIERESTDLCSLWLKIQVEGSLDHDVATLRKFSNYLRRGLPETVIDMNVEKIIIRAEGLHDIARHGDRLMNGQPLVQAMDSASQLCIGKLWRPIHRLLLESSFLWIAGCLSKAQMGVSSLRERFSGLIQNIDAQNEILAEAIAQGAAQIQELDESSLNQLEHDALADSVGLAEVFRLQRLVRYSDNASAPLQVEADTVRRLSKSPVTWQLEAGNELVIVERKSYEKHDYPQKVERAKERVKNLANLLAVEKSEDFHSLACIQWFHDDYHHFFGLVFSIPAPYRPSAMPLLKFLELRIRVPLEQRFKMALCLCHALQKWHSVNWLHKGIRSDNVLIFQHKTSQYWDFANPFLNGQEYARPDLEISSARYVEDFKDNVYCHPDRQGLPRESHTKIHDIYSLGVVLLEIGLWQPVSHFQEFQTGIAKLTPEQMSKYILSNARSRLHHYMGSDYQAAVIKCLVGDLRADIDNVRLVLQLAQDFRTQVTDNITKGIIMDWSAGKQ